MLHPTAAAPHLAGFMPGRLGALGRLAEIRVVLPYRTLPSPRLLRRDPPEMEQAGDYQLLRQPFAAWPGLGRDRRPAALVSACRATVARLHADAPCDVVLGHFLYPDGVAAARLADELGLPYVLVAHGSDVHDHCRVPARLAQVRAAAAGAGALIAVSEPLRQRMVALGLPAESAPVLPCGYDPALFLPRDRAAARLAVGLDDGPWLLFVGMLRPIKRLDLVLDALARLPEVKLAIVGDGPLRARLADQARRRGVARRVRFAGPQPRSRVGLWMAAADCLVLASDHEGTPTVLVETLAVGTPAVATAVGGIPDLLGDVCRLVPPGDVAALAEGLRQTLAAPPAAASLQARVSGLSQTEIAKSEFEVLQSVIS